MVMSENQFSFMRHRPRTINETNITAARGEGREYKGLEGLAIINDMYTFTTPLKLMPYI